MELPALQLDGLKKVFGRTPAVDGIDLSVRPGEMVGFLGPNGAGKSTTMYMITGLVRPSAGRISIFGHDVHRDFVAAMRHVGAMVEAPAFHLELSARKNLSMIARVRGADTHRAVDEVLEWVGLRDRDRDRVAAYSQGMKQRLGLAAALLGSPRLLILDEPTNGLDPEAMHDVLSRIRARVHNENLAVFISSHLLSEVEEFCDRVAIMNRGRLVTEGEVRDILAPHHDQLEVTFQGNVPAVSELLAIEGVLTVTEHDGGVAIHLQEGRDGAWLLRELVGRGMEVSSLVPKRRSLREFFLASTGGNRL